jgi:MYXO-CTERM domain-containing protein
MSFRTKVVLSLAAFSTVFAPAANAVAACCPGFVPSTCPASTISVWCVQAGAPDPGSAALASNGYCQYGDDVVTTLETVFGVKAPGIFEYDVEWPPNGGAHTSTDCTNFGDGASGDLLTMTGYGVAGFWGYLYFLHEAIREWTTMSAAGWPTDWWAGQVNGFPFMMDSNIENSIGTMRNNSALLAAAGAEKMRWYPSGDNVDPRVVALYDVYDMMPSADGLAGFAHMFSMMSHDGRTNWADLGSNPNEKLSEYVLAYTALAVGRNGNQVLKTVQGPGADSAGNICNGFDGNAAAGNSTGDPSYMCNEAKIDAIATAHCALAANGMPAGDRTAFETGNYASVTMGPCGSTCPAECGCDSSTMHCVAAWLAMNGNDAGGSSSSSSGGSSSGSSSGADASASGSTSSSSSSSSGGSSSGVGSSSSGGSSSGVGSSSGGGGNGSSSGGSGGSGGSGSSGASGGSGSGAGNGASPPSSGSGCGCRSAATEPAPVGGLLAAAIVAGIGFARIRRRRRSG